MISSYQFWSRFRHFYTRFYTINYVIIYKCNSWYIVFVSLPPNRFDGRGALAAGKIWSVVVSLPFSGVWPSAFAPKPVGAQEKSNGPEVACRFGQDHNKDNLDMSWYVSNRFHKCQYPSDAPQRRVGHQREVHRMETIICLCRFDSECSICLRYLTRL